LVPHQRIIAGGGQEHGRTIPLADMHQRARRLSRQPIGSSRIEVSVIYSDLPVLTRLNSHSINAHGYLIAGEGLWALSKRDWRMRVAAALAPSRIPALNTVDCSKLSPWLAEPRGAASLGRHAKDGPDAATPCFSTFAARRLSGRFAPIRAVEHLARSW